jgi:hypothetical protein
VETAVETPMLNADQPALEALCLFRGAQQLTVSSPTLTPRGDVFAPGADWREYEGEFLCHPPLASTLTLGMFLWGAHPLGTLWLHLFRIIITGKFEGGAEHAGPPTRCTFIAVGPFLVIPPHLPLAEVVQFEDAVRASRGDAAVLGAYRTWCLGHGWAERAADLASSSLASAR